MGQHSSLLWIAGALATVVVLALSLVLLVLTSLPSPTITGLLRRWGRRGR